MNIVFGKIFAFSPTKEIDVSLGDTSLLAKTEIIILRDMNFFECLIYCNAYKCQ